MAFATTKEVLNGKLFIVDNTVYVGKRVEKIETIRCTNVTASGITKTVPGTIIAVGYANGSKGVHAEYASKIETTKDSFSFKCTNAAYTVTIDVSVFYIPD